MILIVGSTGLLGSEICRQLAEQHTPFRAMVRSDSAPEKVATLRALGAEIVVGDLKYPASLAAACRGVEKVISTASCTFSIREGDSIETVDHQGQLHLVEAAKNAGVKQFIFTSFRDDQTSPLVAAKQAVESALADSGMTWTSLQANYFMEIWLSPALGFNYPAGQARIYGSGDNLLSWVSYKDVARFAVAALDVPFAENKSVPIGGPAALSPQQVVEIFEKATGQAFVVEYVPKEALQQQKDGATNPLEASFAALMLKYAAGDSMDMSETAQHLAGNLTSVEDYAAAVGK